jgi:hypothetical protein
MEEKAYIIYPNGKAAVSSSFLFVRSYPEVSPGSQIIVPERPEVKKLSTAEVVSWKCTGELGFINRYCF